MLSLAMVLLAMHSQRSILFLMDEPSGSLDPENRERLRGFLRQAVEDGRHSCLMTEENALFAKTACDRFCQFVDPGHLQILR